MNTTAVPALTGTANVDASLRGSTLHTLTGDADSSQQPRPNRDLARNAEGCRARARAIKARVLAHYGEQCACCSAVDDLTIDHIDGDGAAHRRELFAGDWGGDRFYRWLIVQGFPGGYQTLCRSCNSSKRTGPACRINHADPAAARRRAAAAARKARWRAAARTAA